MFLIELLIVDSFVSIVFSRIFAVLLIEEIADVISSSATFKLFCES